MDPIYHYIFFKYHGVLSTIYVDTYVFHWVLEVKKYSLFQNRQPAIVAACLTFDLIYIKRVPKSFSNTGCITEALELLNV